jgi:hypothetical protein
MTHRQTRLWLLVPFAALVLLKIPGALTGRLWAEDALYFLDAVHLPWWQALFVPHTGYIDLTASGSMLIATRLGNLEQVGLFSVIMALIVQLLPALLLVTSRCTWLQSKWTLCLALLVVLAPPLTEEVWLSPVTSQYHLMVCSALLLALPTEVGIAYGWRTALLALIAVSGPGPILIAPLYALRACIDREWRRIVQAGIIGCGAVLEFIIIQYHQEPNRHLAISVVLLLAVICYKHVLIPTFGHLANAVMFGMSHLTAAAIGLVGVLAMGLVALLARGREVPWLFLTALVMMVLSYIGALGDKSGLLSIYFGQRYYYAPQVLLGLALLGAAMTGRIGQPLATLTVCWLILLGCCEYWRITPAMADGPAWRAEIAQWRADPSHTIAVWPASFAYRIRMPQ